MNSHMMRRLLILVTAFMLIFTMAASAATVLIMEDTPVYAKPDEDSKCYGTLEAGTKLTMTRSGYGWAELKSGKTVGYVDLDDVEKIKSFSGETVYAACDATFYKDLDTAAGTVDEGTAVRLYATVGDWAYVKYSGKYYFAKIDDLTTEKPVEVEIDTSKSITVYTTGDITLYKDLDTTIGTVEQGEAVELYATKGDWAYISYNGQYAYAKKSRLTTEKPAEIEEEAAQSVTAYVARDGAKTYKNASASSKVIGRLDVNTVVTVTAVKNGWAKVEKSGATGYMKVSDLSTEKIDVIIIDSYSGYAAKDGVKCYDNWDGNGSAVKTLKVNTKIKVTAYNSKWARVEVDGSTYFMYVSSISKTKINTIPDNGSTVMPATGTAREADWWKSDISTKFAVGDVVTVTDVATGIAWREKRVGGTNHADTQPLTAEDTAAMKKACGTFSWTRRAVFVTVDGVNYAASINTMPHGSGDSIPDNNYNGHHCVHFTNSRTHGTNKVCSLHQAAIKKALNATLD